MKNGATCKLEAQKNGQIIIIIMRQQRPYFQQRRIGRGKYLRENETNL